MLLLITNNLLDMFNLDARSIHPLGIRIARISNLVPRGGGALLTSKLNKSNNIIIFLKYNIIEISQ